MPRPNYRLPSDIDYYVFSKVANIYFKSHLWQMRKEPIKTPFLSKSKESDYQESLAIFKLILRFMNDSQLSGQKEKILGDYIINKGIRNEKLRDEIYCQLANQTWKNDNEANCERGWMLMANCLSAFSPSKTLYKYLLKYVSDHAYNGFKSVCQSKLLKSGRMDPHQSRQFPPTVLEWRANKKRVNMALEVTCHDGETNHVPIDSLSTAHSFAARVLKDRGIKEYTGWSVALEDGTELVELNGDDFVLDAVGELELPPAFPANSSQFLVSHDRSRGQIPLTIDTKDRRQYRHSSSPRSSKSKDQASRSKSQDRLLSMPKDDKNFGLANSALNERYFSETKSTRSKSLDNLLPNENNLFGLSESKLNQRYLSQGNQFFERDGDDGSIHMESISQRGGKENWDDIGLSNNPLNDRYFSQPDLDRVAAGRAKSEERDLGKIGRSNSDRQSKMDNEDIDLEQFEYPTERAAGGNRRNMKYIKAHHAHRRRDGMRSSAMSDTSEAPSLASHVRRVRVPSQASDVDQFLDDLFMPVLDGNIDDGLSDARSLAASMRGGADDDVSRATNEILEFKRVGSIRRKSVLPQVTECENDCESLDEELNNLTKVSKLVTMIQGGGSPNPSQGAASPKKQSDFTPITSSAMGFHPIPGVISPHPISGMISPPLIMPTPIQGHQMFSMGSNMGAGGVSSPLLMQANESNPNQPAMAFTYVPVPVYNLGGVGMPMMPGGSTPTPDQPPAPVAPVLNGDHGEARYRRKGDRSRREDSVSSHQTEKTERFELEESSEFLQSVDGLDRRTQNILDELEYQGLEESQTRLHPPSSNIHFSYNRVPWKLRIRKELFSPSEQISEPTTVHLIFCQIVADTFSPLCMRFTPNERKKMMAYMDKYEIDPKKVHSSQHKTTTKMNIITMARDMSTYFSRIYPVASGDQDVDVQYLAITHTGLKLVKREKSLPTDFLSVVEFYSFEDIAEVTTIKSPSLQIVMRTGGRVVLTTTKAASVRDLINQFIIEARSGEFEYKRVLADFSSGEENALQLRAGELVAVVARDDEYTRRGWLYGIRDD